MRNRTGKKFLLPLLGLSLALGSSLVFASSKKNAEQVDAYSASSLPTTIDLNDTSASNIRSYYSSLNNLSTSERQGTNLLKNLKTILKNNQKYYSYENGTSIWQMYEITDRDWSKSPASSTTYGTYNSSTNKITNYTYGTSSSSSKNNPYIHALYINRDVNNQTTAWDDHDQDQWGINREHVWPKAEGFDTSGAGGARGDPMHLMAGNGYANNIHSNYYYGYVSSSGATDCGSKYSNLSGNLRGTSKTLNTGTVFEPQDSDKGDIARAIFYMVARYNYLSGSDSDGINTNNPNLTLTQNISDWSSSGYTSTTSNPGKLGVLTDLLNWHHSDPVDSYEIHRNNLLYTNFTNNRNPFVDFPEWVDFIWGKATYSGSTYQSYSATPTGYAAPNSDTINGYNSGGATVSVTGVSLNKNSTSITVGGAETLEASVAPSNATNQGVTWSSSNTSVATVTNGVVRGVAEGNATITVTTSDGGYTATCTVTITASGGGGGGISETSYVKIGSLNDLESGDYVIAADLSSSYKGMSYTFSNNKYSGTDVTVSNDAISLADGNSRKFTLSVTGSGDTRTVTINDLNANKYVGYSSSTNLSRQDNAYSWTVSSGTKGTFRFTSGTAGRGLIFRASTYNVYGGYATSNVTANGEYYDLELFKYTEVQSQKSLDSISLDASDAQTTFNVGDTFNYDDLVVTAYYDDGTDDIVTPTSVSTPDMSTAGQKTVTVTYTEGGVTKTATYTITVNSVSLVSIAVSGAKTAYYVGDTFVKPTVTATFSNGSTSDVTNSATFSGYNLSNAGNQTVTVSYTSGTTQTTTYSITVTALSVTSISVSGYKNSFKVGDAFSFGGTVTATYNNGSTGDVTASASFTGYNMSTTGIQVVTVSYSGQTTTYQINVSEDSDATDDTQYTLINSISDLEVGKSYIITNGTSGTVQAIAVTSNSNNRKTTDVTISDNKITRGSSVMSLTLGGTSGAYTFETENYAGTSGYLASAASGTSNYLRVISTAGTATISFDGDAVLINIGPHTTRTLIQYNANNGNPLFACYSSNQSAVYLWKEISSSPSLSWDAPTIDVFTGATLSGTDVNGWDVTYNDGAGNTTVLTYSQMTIKLAGTTISIPHTWVAADDGKTLTASYSSLTTSESSAVRVTQTINTITKVSEDSSSTSDLTFSAACGGSGTADDSKTWRISSDASESTYDSTKGIHYGTGSAAVEYIQLVSNSFTTGTITQVVVNASGASGVSGSVSVTVGGNAFDEVKSFNSTASDKTFTGSASAGQIIVRIYKASAAVKAIYCKSVKVTYTTSGSTVTISNSTSHIEAQRAAVKFAKAFNSAMSTTSYCTANISSAWSTCTSAYNTFVTEAAALGETEEAYAKDLIRCATRVYSDDSGEACIERMMKTYEIIVGRYGSAYAFMSDLVTLGSPKVSPLLNVVGKNTNTIAIIVIISMVSVTAIGGYFFLRKRKEQM